MDDSRTMQVLLETAFSDRPDFALVGIAGSAQLGAEMIIRLKPDIATIDLCMPYIDGAGLLAMVDRPPNTCMIMVSDSSTQNVVMTAKLLNLGAEACISKREISDNRNAFFDKIYAAHESFLSKRKHGNTSIAADLSNVEQSRGLFQRGGAANGFPVPLDEDHRLNVLRSTQLANAVRERHFDLVTKHLAAETAFPVCLLTFIDKDTQWIKSRFGLEVECTPREQAFCNYTICQDGAFVVANAAADERFADNPLV